MVFYAQLTIKVISGRSGYILQRAERHTVALALYPSVLMLHTTQNSLQSADVMSQTDTKTNPIGQQKFTFTGPMYFYGPSVLLRALTSFTICIFFETILKTASFQICMRARARVCVCVCVCVCACVRACVRACAQNMPLYFLRSVVSLLV